MIKTLDHYRSQKESQLTHPPFWELAQIYSTH